MKKTNGTKNASNGEEASHAVKDNKTTLREAIFHVDKEVKNKCNENTRRGRQQEGAQLAATNKIVANLAKELGHKTSLKKGEGGEDDKSDNECGGGESVKIVSAKLTVRKVRQRRTSSDEEAGDVDSHLLVPDKKVQASHAADLEDLRQRLLNKPKSNSLVEKGAAAADVFGLRALETTHSAVERGLGTMEERKQRLKQKMMGDKDLGEVVIDDSWEDSVGLVKIKAKDFTSRGQRQNPTQKPPGWNQYRANLPLVYSSLGEPLPPCRPAPQAGTVAGDAQLQEEMAELVSKWTTPGEDGLFRMATADVLVAKQMMGWPSVRTLIPNKAKVVVERILADKTSSEFNILVAPKNPNRLYQLRAELDEGKYRFVRVTNGSELDGSTFMRCFMFFNWAEILGEHCGSYFEPKVAAEEKKEEPLSLLDCLDEEDEGEGRDDMSEDIIYIEELIRSRFAQYIEWLERDASKRECSMCRKPGANCVLLPVGDHDSLGLEWADPVCPHMTCRPCITNHMMRCDLTLAQAQRCRDCLSNYGGYHVHDANTKKLMLFQAAKTLLMFWPPRKLSDPILSFNQFTIRMACIKAVVTYGLLPALHLPVQPNRSLEIFSVFTQEGISSGWSTLVDLKGDSGNGYHPNELDGRIFLTLAEAEAQLENFEQAGLYAHRAAELFAALPSGTHNIDDPYALRSHPARQLIIPARHIAKEMVTAYENQRRSKKLVLKATSNSIMVVKRKDKDKKKKKKKK